MAKQKSELFLNPKHNITTNEMFNYRFPVEVTIAISVFFASNVGIQNALSYHNVLFNQANKILAKYNMICNHITFESKPLPFQERAYLEEHVEELRGKAHKVYDDQVDDVKKIQRIPVIYVNTIENRLSAGQTFMNLGWLPFILIYPNVKGDNSDNATLIHEIGHCAGLNHNVRKNDSRFEDILMTAEDGFNQKMPSTPFKRENISRLQAEKILKSYFTSINFR